MMLNSDYLKPKNLDVTVSLNNLIYNKSFHLTAKDGVSLRYTLLLSSSELER